VDYVEDETYDGQGGGGPAEQELEVGRESEASQKHANNRRGGRRSLWGRRNSSEDGVERCPRELEKKTIWKERR
jgi:hypothetical protein